MRLSDYLKLGANNFRRNGYKTALPIMIITIGIVLFNILSGFFTSMTDSTKEAVTDNNSLRFIDVSPVTEGFTQSDFDKLKGIEGVLTSFPDVRNGVYMDYKGEMKSTELIGINPEAVPYYTSGKAKTIRENEIILSSDYASLFEVGRITINHHVNLTNTEVMYKEKEATVQSFYDPFYISSYPSEMEPISLADINFVEQLNAEGEKMQLQEYRKKHLPTRGVVIAKTVEDVPSIGKKLDEMGYVSSYALKSANQVPMTVKIISIIGGIVIFVLLLSSGASIASVIGSSLRGRYKEIGVLRALGFERGHLIRLFSIEIIYMALISFILSIAISVLLMSGMEHYINNTFMKGNSYTFVLNMDEKKVLISFLLILEVSFLASVRPILKASSINITEIIRGNAS